MVKRQPYIPPRPLLSSARTTTGDPMKHLLALTLSTLLSSPLFAADEDKGKNPDKGEGKRRGAAREARQGR